MRKFILVILASVWSLSLLSQEKFKIENPHLVVSFHQGKISLVSKKSQFQVQQIHIPGNILRSSKGTVVDSLLGKAQQIEISNDNGRTITFRLYPSDPFVHVHTIIHNQLDKDIRMNRLDFATIEIPVTSANPSLHTLGIGGLRPLEKAEGSFSYTLLANPMNKNSVLVAWLTQLQGIGTMMPKWNEQTGIYSINTELELGNFLIKPKEKRSTDILLIGFFDDGRQGLELYGDCLAKVYHIQLPPKPEVYSTWYHRHQTGSGASNEQKLIENAQFVKDSLADFGLNTFQIDDHWQSSMIAGRTQTKKIKNSISLSDGPITNFMEGNLNFPSGMQAIATCLQKEDITAGIWFMPFSADVNSRVFNLMYPTSESRC